MLKRNAGAPGGDCDIRFQPQGTTFTMRCPPRQPLEAHPENDEDDSDDSEDLAKALLLEETASSSSSPS